MVDFKYELKYIMYSIGFAALFFLVLLPNLTKMFDGNSPFTQFLIFNLGLIVFLQIFLKSMTLKTSVSIKTSIGLVLLFIALDILQPPYAVDFSGNLISNGPLLMQSSSDYIAGLIAQNFGLEGIKTYIFTYIIVPFILLFSSSYLIKNFVKEI